MSLRQMDEKLRDLTNYYSIPVTVDNFNNIKRENSSNEQVTVAISDEFDRIILKAVEKGLDEK